MPLEAASRPLSSSRPSATSRATISDTAGVKALSTFCLRVARPLPVEVVARQRRPGDLLPGGGRHGGGREPGRRHQRLLRAGDDDIEAPVVHLQRTAPRLETASTTAGRPRPWRRRPATECRRRRRSRSPSGRGRRATRARSSGRGPPAASLPTYWLPRPRSRRCAPLTPSARRSGPRRPPERTLTGEQEVDDRRLERARPRAGEGARRSRPVDLLEPRGTRAYT